MSEYLRACEEAARSAGAVLLDWQGRFQVREKGPADLVTEADWAAQKIIRRMLLGQFPDHDFVGEEDTSRHSSEKGDEPTGVEGDGCRWLVDPLDGTTNYVHGLPQFCVSIALERGKELLVGTVFDPVSGQLFSAEAGKGAFLDGHRLHTSQVSHMSDALVAASFRAKAARKSEEVKQFLEVLPRCQAIRRMGSTALNLCYLAAGQLDAYWGISARAWDVAAGILIVREAGGVVTAVDGGPFDLDRPTFAAAATPPLHQALVGILAGI